MASPSLGARWLLGSIAASAYALSAAPGPSFIDSGELDAAARTLGVLHPPGHPLWLSLAQLCECLPLGPYTARLAWLSALGGGLCVVLLARMAERLATPPDEPTGARAAPAWIGLCAALALAACGSLWTVAVRAEVYTLALLANLWMLDAAMRASDAARKHVPPHAPIGEAALALALGLTNHHFVTALAAPAALALAWPGLLALWRTGGGARALLAPGLASASVLLLYLALPLRALQGPEMSWGDPTTPRGLWDAVTARQFQSSLGRGSPPLDNVLGVTALVAMEIGPVALVMGLGGLTTLLAARRSRRIGLGIALMLAGGIAAKSVMLHDPSNPDDHGYILAAPVALCLGAAALFAWLDARLREATDAGPRVGRIVTAGLALALAGPAVAVGLHNTERELTNLAGLRAPDLIDDAMRRALPVESVLLGDHYVLVFNEAAFRLAEGRRPDLGVAHLTFHARETDDGRAAARNLAARTPVLKRVAAAYLDTRRIPLGELLDLAERWPVYTELDQDPVFPADALDFKGLVHHIKPLADRNLDYDPRLIVEAHGAFWQRLSTSLAAHSSASQEARSLLLWQHALNAAHALRRGHVKVAEAELARAGDLGPGDPQLAALAKRLGLLHAAWARGDAQAFRDGWMRYRTMTFDGLLEDD